MQHGQMEYTEARVTHDSGRELQKWAAKVGTRHPKHLQNPNKTLYVPDERATQTPVRTATDYCKRTHEK